MDAPTDSPGRSGIALRAMKDHRGARPETLLITLTGKDRPGVTSSIFATLSRAGVEVVDLEQIVLRRRLILGVLVTTPRDWKRAARRRRGDRPRPRA